MVNDNAELVEAVESLEALMSKLIFRNRVNGLRSLLVQQHLGSWDEEKDELRSNWLDDAFRMAITLGITEAETARMIIGETTIVN